ncbi:MAG: hypothetical protein AAFP83_12675, partial [Bacteroidota bacterium]
MTAKDLLHVYLDYVNSWIHPSNTDILPAKMRLQQIHALQKAFGLQKPYGPDEGVIKPLEDREGEAVILNDQVEAFILTSKPRKQRIEEMSHLAYLEKGEFLIDRPQSSQDTFIKKVREKVGEVVNPRLSQSSPIRLNALFSMLLQFRLQAYALIHPPLNFRLGFSMHRAYSDMLQYRVKKILNENLEEIDHTLWELLDP